jgi:hypothetical protein
MSSQRERIQSLLSLAQHPNTPQAEAETALAMASKLMQKHGLSETDIAEVPDENVSIVSESVVVTGPYRVRRVNVLYVIAKMHSCASYRAHDSVDGCVLVVYGRQSDIFATRTLFAAADALGARLLPRGSRSWRVSWWSGFQSGIEESLSGARKEFISETQGAGLVLADRMKRAEDTMYVFAPPLRGGTYYSDTSSGAHASGKNAGRGFGASGRSFTSGVRGELQ